ncbi:sugar phosphate isomerase/epimerase [Vibrio sp. S4M6]|uniref:sugar phosphate isomerase/epimerase family protein n=1 Tax=Vibrio sinus TaxID=2946865 RepID=UPI002029EF1A|nr:sugar phosphate isomerase/epimerase family protein [Vibrio sinus]MCL9782231.1 sugar phosphate isomerase/epimerase [Vibrio sinus]
MYISQLPKKIGFSTNIYDNPEDISQLVSNLSNAFEVVEIEFEKDLRRKVDSSDEHWSKQSKALNQEKEEKGLYYSVHAPYLGMETDISNSDEIVRIVAVDYIKKYIVKAHDIGAKYFTIHPGYVEHSEDGISHFDFSQLKKSLIELVDYSKHYDMKILLENTGADRDDYIVLSDEQHDELCNEIGIGLTLDLVHFHSFYSRKSKEEYLSHLKRLIPNVYNAHFNDVLNGEHVHLPLMKGNFNYDEVLKFMSKEGFQGNFILEESGGGYSPEAFLQAGERYIKELANA